MQNIKINPLIHPNLLNNTFDTIKITSLKTNNIKIDNNKYTKFILNVGLPMLALIALCFVLRNKYIEKMREKNNHRKNHKQHKQHT